MKFRPLHDRVVVERIDPEAKSAGGIIIPDTAQEKPSQGEIIAVGPGVTDAKVGDRVVAYTGNIGGYAVERTFPADRLIKLPDSISYEQAAGMSASASIA